MKVSKTKKDTTTNLYIPYISLKTVIKLLNGEYIFFHHMIKFSCLNQFLMSFLLYNNFTKKYLTFRYSTMSKLLKKRTLIYV